MPEGVNPGDTIHVQAPDGRLNEIVVPAGMYAGSTFTVEFADAPPPSAATAPMASPTKENDGFASGFGDTHPSTYSYVPAVVAPQVVAPNEDDGFVTGFNNPHAVTAVPAEPDINLGASYPTAPVYPSAPSYPSAK